MSRLSKKTPISVTHINSLKSGALSAQESQCCNLFGLIKMSQCISSGPVYLCTLRRRFFTSLNRDSFEP
ncbi:10113_t:CDS:2 [Acaulospora morrowiae]|uniref:10113_t:CDS:1 n=1 Tax=Acaulospora morrowiae TaxID=94023 RepID=A0A9N9AKG7_9GLOM|nr:10113_t:CDS:2 [Acaulospora morrowiae]